MSRPAWWPSRRAIDADVAPKSTEPLTHQHAPEAHANAYTVEDAASGCEYVDDRLRLAE